MDALPQARTAWGAWGDVRRGGEADANLEAPREWALEDVVEISVGQEQGVREQGVRRRDGRRRLELRAAPAARAARVLCTLDAGRFVERSCAAQEWEEPEAELR